MTQEIRDLLEDIKTASGKRQCDVFYYLKADQALKLLSQPKCSTCGDKKPEIYSKWLCELQKEDEFTGHTHIRRTGSQKRELYQIYVDSFPPFHCPDCNQPKDQPSSEFTEEMREKLDHKLWEFISIGDFYETLDRLDTSEASRRELLEACEAQHEAIDRLFAMLIEKGDGFYPSKSGQPWEAIQQGNIAITNAKKG